MLFSGGSCAPALDSGRTEPHHEPSPTDGERVTRGRNRPLCALLALLAFAGLASLSVSACGAEAEIEETIKRFNRAAAEGDGKRACGELTPEARAPAGGLQCEWAIDQLGRLGGERTRERLGAVEVRDVKVTGKWATAEARIPTQTPTTLRLEKVPRRVFSWMPSDGKWKIAALGAAPGGGFQ
jgi:hypothetical protein